jgi:hypothetical protein
VWHQGVPCVYCGEPALCTLISVHQGRVNNILCLRVCGEHLRGCARLPDPRILQKQHLALRAAGIVASAQETARQLRAESERAAEVGAWHRARWGGCAVPRA